jgi:hypothetical protein
MAAAREHGKNASRDFEPLLDWLVTVRVYAERNRLWTYLGWASSCSSSLAAFSL